MAQILKRIDHLSLLIAILAVAIIMVLVSADAVMRYAMNAPIRWAAETTRLYLMVIAVYFAVSSTFTHGDHIGITLFRHYFPTRLLLLGDVAWTLMTAVVFGIIAYGTWLDTMHAFATNQFTPGYIMYPTWLSQLPIPMGSALITLRLVHHAIVLATKGNDPDVALEGDTAE